MNCILSRIWRASPQRGAALILFLGVAAALAVLSTAMVTLVNNSLHNTSRESMRMKAFDVAEAALDITMQDLGTQWPSKPRTDLSGQPVTWSFATVAPDFRTTHFPVADFPDPRAPGVDVVKVILADALDATGKPIADTAGKPIDYDANGDGYMWIDSQAVLGDRAARVRAKVQAVYFQPNLPQGIALWSAGAVTNAGTAMSAGKPIVSAEMFPPGSTTISVISYEGLPGALTDPASLALLGPPYVGWTLGTTDDPLNATEYPRPISDATIEGLTSVAANMTPTRLFTGPQAATNAMANTGLEGLVVIDLTGTSGTLDIGPGSYNDPAAGDNPGILMVLHGDIRFHGSPSYWGVVYAEGNIGSQAGGTPQIHGMVVCDGDFDFNGTPDIRYNDQCITGLDSQWQTSTRLVPNYWRELKPDLTPNP